MTIVKNHKDYIIDGLRFFVQRYADKPHFVWFWRYGYIIERPEKKYCYIISDGLRSRPNLKRLFGA